MVGISLVAQGVAGVTLRLMALEPAQANHAPCDVPIAAAMHSSGLCGRSLVTWLTHPDIQRTDGQILSWKNPVHPGFAYPEATALWLSWAAWRQEQQLVGPPVAATMRAAAWLHTELETSSTIGRGGSRYLFDTGLGFHALVRAARVPGWPTPNPATLCKLSAGLDTFLDADCPIDPAPEGEPRWSERWSGHLVRSAALVLRAGLWLDHAPTKRRAHRILDRSERIRGERPCYLHTLAYQAEGELLLSAIRPQQSVTPVHEAARRLARLQRPDGLLPGWSDRPGTAHCDTTAQAVRLWAALDPHRYAGHIQVALAALGRCQRPSGGLPYLPHSQDLNTWVALFADQALSWTRHGADPAALL